MPCTAKKMEAARDEFKQDGQPDVDLVLTTREIIDMINENGIRLPELELESPDLPFGLGSGAAAIYGVTGGVAEAVVRHCLPDKSKNALRAIEFMGLRGQEGIREATVDVGGTELKKISADESGGQDGILNGGIFGASVDPHPGTAVHEKTVVDHIVGTACSDSKLVTTAPHVEIGKLEP